MAKQDLQKIDTWMHYSLVDYSYILTIIKP